MASEIRSLYKILEEIVAVEERDLYSAFYSEFQSSLNLLPFHYPQHSVRR